VRPDLPTPPVPDTPTYWAQLEGLLREGARRPAADRDVPETPRYNRELRPRLQRAAMARRRAEPFPVLAVAAAVSLIVLTALTLALLPHRSGPTTAATPGTVSTTTVETVQEISAEAMVVASFERWVDGRTEAERLQNRYLHAGYDVVVERQPVAVADLNGEVLEVRHPAGPTVVTVNSVTVRGQVILVVGQAYHVGGSISL
jgi:hypothetical protein